MTDTAPVTLAAIIGAHGVAGEVRLKLFGEGVESLKGHKTFNDGAFTLKKVRDDNKGGAIARLAEVQSRSAAEKLRGTTLSVPRDALPSLPEDEYYHADLIGLAAASTNGDALGEVIAVHNFGAGDVIEIQRPPQDGKTGKTFMVPMRVEAVPAFDTETITVSEDYADQ
ncbi:MAG: ribosome maturation factor RimM [Alteraurantiacibacter sp.]